MSSPDKPTYPQEPDPACWQIDPDQPKWCANQANHRTRCPAGYCFAVTPSG